MGATLLVGFDSAWTAANRGAVVGVLCTAAGGLRPLGPPVAADYREAESLIGGWQTAHTPGRSLILVDQPTIVANATGQRPVERIVCSAVSRRRGGMQPACTRKATMFGPGAPLWPFLERFGGAALPDAGLRGSRVIETYPVLTLIALGWTQTDARGTGRLPKYNPAVRRTFRVDDWRVLCGRVEERLRNLEVGDLASRVAELGATPEPRKADQDALDACICLLVGLHLHEGGDCLVIGDDASGYILVPASAALARELEERCRATGRDPAAWVRSHRLARPGSAIATQRTR